MTHYATPMAATRRSFALRLGLVAGALAVLVVAGGALYYRDQREELRQAIWRELDAVADLKVRQLADWRKERLSEGRFLSQTAGVARDVTAFLANPTSAAARDAVADWLRSIKGGDRYESVLLLDSTQKVHIAIPADATAPHFPLKSRLSEVFESGELTMTDLHRADPVRGAHIDLLAPIFATGASREPIAIVVLRIEPAHYLFPVVRNWPTPSASAEAMLVRFDGDTIVYLHEPRHATPSVPVPGPANDLGSLGPARSDSKEGIREGHDYRGVPVLAAVRRVAGTPWHIIAKIDQKEAYAPIRQEARTVGRIVGVIILGLAGAAAYLWRIRNEQILRRTLSAEQESRVLAERLALLTRHANDIVMLADEKLRIVEINDRGVEAYGYAADEFRSLTISDLRAPDAAHTLVHDVEKLRANGSVLFETVHQRKDHTCFPVEVSSRAVAIGGRQYILGILRDITERKRAEAALRESQTALAAQLDELRRWHAVTLGRETRILELKAEINRLLAAAGQPPRYSSAETKK
jgi:PAS domain S-box-containing protein